MQPHFSAGLSAGLCYLAAKQFCVFGVVVVYCGLVLIYCGVGSVYQLRLHIGAAVLYAAIWH